MDGGVVNTTFYTGNTGNELYAGGKFSTSITAPVTPLYNLSVYNTSGPTGAGPASWIPTGSGLNPGFNTVVNTIGYYPGDTDLVIGGEFTQDNNGNDLPYICQFSTTNNVYNIIDII